MMKVITPSLLCILAITSYSSSYADSISWVDGNLVRTLDGSNHNGVSATITLDDWGFVGPNGRTAEDFEPINGFGNNAYTTESAAACIADPASCGIGQIQRVITTGPDGLTQDPPHDILGDFRSSEGPFPQANVDSMTTFYKWGYTSAAGSTFSNMLIDFDGDYKIAKDDMAFEFYSFTGYQQIVPEGESRIGTVADGAYNTRLAFQPYALSDAKGWCGSVLASHPNAHESMAGQVTFDVAFDVYFVEDDGSLTYFSTEIINGFQMRSFGDIVLDVTYAGGETQQMYATAIVNNTDPTVVSKLVGADAPVGDPEIWHNKVSFMGADLIPGGGGKGDCGTLTPEWAAGERGPGIKKFSSIDNSITDVVECYVSGRVWQSPSFPGYPFILRADATRIPEYFDESVYGPDPMTTDTDSDGIFDYADNCPNTPNADQRDSGGIDTNIADGIGDACQCGDISGDGRITNTDSVLIKRHLLGLPSNFQADFCDVNADGQCTNTDAVILNRALLGLPPGINQSCPAAGN